MTELFVKHSLTIFCLLFVFVDSKIFGSKEKEDEGSYVFAANVKMPVQSRCRKQADMDEIDRTFLLATKNFLYNVKQRTPSYTARASDPENESEEITLQRCVKKIYPDGNCLFRAISYCMYKTEENHRSVRRDIVNHVVENWSEYTDFIVGSNIYSAPINTAVEYENYMNKAAVWGAQVEIIAATRVYKVCLQVFTSSNSFHKMGDEEGACTTFALHYSGDGYYGHYDVVEDVPLPCLAEPTGYTSENIVLPVTKSILSQTYTPSIFGENRWSSPGGYLSSTATENEWQTGRYRPPTKVESRSRWETGSTFSAIPAERETYRPLSSVTKPYEPSFSMTEKPRDWSILDAPLQPVSFKEENRSSKRPLTQSELNWPSFFRAPRDQAPETNKPSELPLITIDTQETKRLNSAEKAEMSKLSSPIIGH